MPFKAEGAQGELPGIAWVTMPAMTAAVKQDRHPAGADCSCRDDTVRTRPRLLRAARCTSHYLR